MAVCEETTLDRTEPSRTIAALVSSQDVSMARRVIGSTEQGTSRNFSAFLGLAVGIVQESVDSVQISPGARFDYIRAGALTCDEIAATKINLHCDFAQCVFASGNGAQG